MYSEKTAKREWNAPQVTELGDLRDLTQGTAVKYFGSDDGFLFGGQPIGNTPPTMGS